MKTPHLALRQNVPQRKSIKHRGRALPDSKPFIVTSHAAERLVERNIEAAWLEMAFREPDEAEQQAGRETRWRLWRKIPQDGDRVLCVVADEHDDRFEIATVFFDRRKKR